MESWLNNHYSWCSSRLKFLSLTYGVLDHYEDIVQSYCLYNFELLSRGKGVRKVDHFFYSYMTRTLKIWHRKDMSKEANKHRDLITRALSIDSEDEKINISKLKIEHEFYGITEEVAEGGVINDGTQTQVYGLYFIQEYKISEIVLELGIHRNNVRYHINEIENKVKNMYKALK